MSTNNWTTIKKKEKTAAAGGYVPPSQRKAPEPTFDEMFPEGILPVAPLKKSVWVSNFKEAIEKKNDVSEPVKDDTILASYTNPRTGRTTIVRDMPFHPDDKVGIQEANVIVPNIKKKVPVKRRALDDDDDSSFLADEESHAEEEHYDNFSEEEEKDEVVDDYVSE